MELGWFFRKLPFFKEEFHINVYRISPGKGMLLLYIIQLTDPKWNFTGQSSCFL